MSTTFEVANGDIVMDVRTGRPALVTGRDKLRQDLHVVLATEARTDNVGAGLDDVANGQPTDEFEVRASITTRLEVALESMARLQERWNRTTRGPEERVRGLRSVYVTSVSGSKTDYYFRLEVASADGGRTAVAGSVRT